VNVPALLLLQQVVLVAFVMTVVVVEGSDYQKQQHRLLQ
jgi:hypothetical protein